MSRVINRNNYSSQRNSYLRFVSTALQAYEPSTPNSQKNKDIIIFIFLTLKEIGNSLEKTTQPWEKRGYWVKVEQFMQEWNWVTLLIRALEKLINTGQWQRAGKTILELNTL